MAHFARLDENNVVVSVHTVDNDYAPDEATGIAFLENLHGLTGWKQTSYNGNIRKNYAGIGYTYDPVRDAFIPPKPFPSWLLNETTCRWDSPTPMPQDGKRYTWDEALLNWKEIT